MKQISLSEVANITGITKSKIKYWANLLNLEIKKQNRILFLPLGSETILLAVCRPSIIKYQYFTHNFHFQTSFRGKNYFYE
jgi:hypothetical protein